MNAPANDYAALLAALCQLREQLPARTAAVPDEPPRLRRLGDMLGLSRFERNLLLLCAGIELDPAMASACAEVRGAGGAAGPSFAVAMHTLAEPHWDAITPEAPLRRWRLLEIEESGELLHARLRIDERVLHHLAGVDPLDARLQAYCRPVISTTWLPPSLARHAERIAAALSKPLIAPLVELVAVDPSDAVAVAAQATQTAGLRLYRCNAEDLPDGPVERRSFGCLWSREALIARRALLIDGSAADLLRRQRAASLAAGLSGAVFTLGDDRFSDTARATMRAMLERPASDEQQLLWQRGLGKTASATGPALQRVVGQFRLGVTALERAVAQTRAAVAQGEDAAAALWQAARQTCRPRLRELAQHIESRAGWDDLVLPAHELDTLRAIAAQVRHRHLVYHEWGFGERQSRGLGISALFCGVSGTGKTMAAEVLAGALELDLYRIDLSTVVSKYIGETEKNLSAVFDAAEQGGAVLLFDEAEALFGKRSEVRDSHDRYANIEVGYLLQRMESYRGLAILTTNMKSALDTAFLRRIRFVVEFPFPSPQERLRMWRRAFPPRMPAGAIDYGKLARLNITGGHIRSMALHAAVLAADTGEALHMGHLLAAARAEYAKLERPLSTQETEGWA